MTLSIASNAAAYGKPFGYGLAGLPPVAPVVEAAQVSGAASWSYVPPSASAGRRHAGLSGVMADLSRLPADPDATAAAGRSWLGNDASGSRSDSAARSDAADLLRALKDTDAASALPTVLPSRQSAAEQGAQTVQVLALRPATNVMSTLQLGLPTQDALADPSISAADAQLQALFKTLQAYGL